MDEAKLGLERYYTEDLPGIGGKLRKTPDDFVVDEVSLKPPEKPSGAVVIARVWHRNWEANRLVRRLGSNLRIGRPGIGFAGTKDGRSIATQLMSFRGVSVEDVKALEIPDVRILEAYAADRMISIGDLIGNRFAVNVKDIDEGVEVSEVCRCVKSKLAEIGGFPNYFGVQRFGSIRPITHMIGSDLVRGDFEGAVMRYVANPIGNGSEGEDARHALQETGDFSQAMKDLPQKFTFERVMVSHLVERPGDYVGAIRRLPRNLQMMFVHAYQSYIFNRILSERLRRGLPIHLPIAGDIVLPLNKNGVPDQDRPIAVTHDNLEKVRRNSSEGKAFVSGVLFGSESVLAGGEMGEIESDLVGREGISREDFQIVGLREASSKGTRRELLAAVNDIGIFANDDAARFEFTLNKGCYATVLLREFMKAGITSY
ncbi:MAG: tRNA pseudouridine(13) synthase TruD [Methanobacteriota archaeon]|nr:MAG: tRNA pseudouridine(13) synthase TruD [Euryarchaeota archaeon]